MVCPLFLLPGRTVPYSCAAGIGAAAGGDDRAEVRARQHVHPGRGRQLTVIEKNSKGSGVVYPCPTPQADPGVGVLGTGANGLRTVSVPSKTCAFWRSSEYSVSHPEARAAETIKASQCEIW